MKQRVLITGCSSGIGRALALEMHRRGFQVAATARDVADLAGLDKDILKVRCDINDEDSILSCVNETVTAMDGIDILVNNAGYGAVGPLAEIPREDLRAQFETNVIGQVAMVRHALPFMPHHKGSMIINVGSVSGVLATPFVGPYGATKAAMHIVTDVLRVELKPFGIHVAALQPGAIASRFGENASKEIGRYKSEGSLYHSIYDAIAARAMEAQHGAASADDLAVWLTDRIEKGKVPAVMRFGPKSFLLPFLKKALPWRILDSILYRRYKLFHLGEG